MHSQYPENIYKKKKNANYSPQFRSCIPAPARQDETQKQSGEHPREMMFSLIQVHLQAGCKSNNQQHHRPIIKEKIYISFFGIWTKTFLSDKFEKYLACFTYIVMQP
jgi:hypothetical protein